MLSVSLIPAVSIMLHIMPLITIFPSTISLVVPSISVTIAFSSSRRVFRRLLFPTFGFPIIPIFIPSFINLPSDDSLMILINLFFIFKTWGYIFSDVTTSISSYSG